jgi:hypothetical protein
MNKRKDHPITLNTKNPHMARLAIKMLRNGWVLAEVRSFWMMKLNPPSRKHENNLVKYLW